MLRRVHVEQLSKKHRVGRRSSRFVNRYEQILAAAKKFRLA
jgi:hypothetical protein